MGYIKYAGLETQLGGLVGQEVFSSVCRFCIMKEPNGAPYVVGITAIVSIYGFLSTIIINTL